MKTFLMIRTIRNMSPKKREPIEIQRPIGPNNGTYFIDGKLLNYYVNSKFYDY